MAATSIANIQARLSNVALTTQYDKTRRHDRPRLPFTNLQAVRRDPEIWWSSFSDAALGIPYSKSPMAIVRKKTTRRLPQHSRVEKWRGNGRPEACLFPVLSDPVPG